MTQRIFPALDTNNTFTGTEQFSNVEAVRYVDSANSQGWAGTDIGGWLNSAYAALPASGGEIVISNLGTGCMAFSTPVTFTTSGKYVLLRGMTGSTADPNAGACLNYTPTTGTSAFTLDYVPVSKTVYTTAHGWRDITLINNGGCQTTGGCGGTLAFGIQIGASNQGIQGATMIGVTLNGFADAFVNQSFNSVDVVWINPTLVCNNEGYFFTNVNSQIIYGGQFTGNGIAIKAGAGVGGEMILNGVNFLANNQGAIVLTGATTPVQLNVTDCHFENSTSLLDTTHYITGNFNLTMKGGLMEDDVPSGVCTTNCDFYISSSGNYMNIYGTLFSAPFRIPTQVIQLNSPVRAYIHAVNNAPSVLTTFIGGANTAFATLKVDNAGTGNAATLTQWEGPFKAGFTGIGDATFVPNTGVVLDIRFNSTNFDALNFVETTTGFGNWRMGPGTGGVGFSLRNQTNVKQMWNMANATPWAFQLPQGLLDLTEVAAPAGLASNDRVYADSTVHWLKASMNNGSFGFFQFGGLTNPTYGNNPTTFQCAETTDAQDCFAYSESAAATGGTLTNLLANQALLSSTTSSASTATPLEIQQGSVTATTGPPIAQFESTWNNASLVGQGLVLNVTNTNSAAGSLLENLRVGNATQWSVDKAGNTIALGTGRAKLEIADQGTACANGNIALSAGWGTTAAATAAAGQGQTCQWTFTASGTGQAANPTITWTLPTALPSASVVCVASMVGGTQTFTSINHTTLSATAPVFTFNGTPVAGNTVFVALRCGP